MGIEKTEHPLSYEMENEIRGYHVWRDVRIITTCNLLKTDLELSSEDGTFAVGVQKLDKLIKNYYLLKRGEFLEDMDFCSIIFFMLYNKM